MFSFCIFAGIKVKRKCDKNDKKNCKCQGAVGASYTFGCTRNRYTPMCKFAVGRNKKKRK